MTEQESQHVEFGADDDIEILPKDAPAGRTLGRRAANPYTVQEFMTAKQFLPSGSWINKNVLIHDPGHKVPVCRFVGYVTHAMQTTNEYEGKQIPSVKLEGAFRGQSFVDAEIKGRAPTLYLPKAYAKQLLGALEMAGDGARALVDVEIGLETTGKTIPYRWTCTTYIEDESDKLLNEMWNSPHPALLATKHGQKALGHDADGVVLEPAAAE